ncbi:endonuclease/exonuclease/phosphatase family protein [Fusobacterium necrophorum]|uniref:LuxR family transcriptional regulator n=1 Tax=Fusobacterium necrophorum TaxID=859 RepID=A0A4Q2KXE0_9FUSO|nr:endonuclease/exonuclease/phosphatase family protein [Fusobacterium necrophorum]AYV92559.1 LuxR family transcriptional regulator [Fusobacterium necrophorum subsp. funduliforme]EIJ69905.1 endonuclease/exonuclease/phosphatase family protein [Fusobacterium necrophorum subsp. funduliforme ATCC 51357]KAB0553175.1 endonuclease/exonuclease/phosphatase family protein [Fusobacterium necrophorum subsp. funduliforme]KYM43524.1 LuxR family transcriptional regulator [Fusobacterium necrophorum subsp. fundu
MKKLKGVILFFLFTLSLYANTGKVASFNTLHLGTSKKDYKLFCETIRDFDLVGLEEVMKKEAVENLVKELNKNTGSIWEGHISQHAVGENGYNEFYGYVWKKDKVKLIKQEGFYPDPDNKFVREPYGATFKIGNFDFTFVLQHAVYGKKVLERKLEAAELVKVYDYFQDRDIKENDILIAGDFNLSASDKAFDSLYNHRDNITCTLDPKTKTTVGTKGLSSAYDNIFISKKYTTEYTGKSGIVDFTNKKYGEARKKISDHLPIYIEVNTDKDDD